MLENWNFGWEAVGAIAGVVTLVLYVIVEHDKLLGSINRVRLPSFMILIGITLMTYLWLSFRYGLLIAYIVLGSVSFLSLLLARIVKPNTYLHNLVGDVYIGSFEYIVLSFGLFVLTLLIHWLLSILADPNIAESFMHAVERIIAG
jgi:hypothetical protein